MNHACILTFAKVSNRGANLQAYGLSKYLKEHGMSSTFIVLKEKKVKSNIKGRIYERINNFLAGFFRRETGLSFTKTYHNSHEFKKDLPKADIYIVGSDQVWNPILTKSNALGFFFDFLPDNAKRVSYAASIGEKEWTFHDMDEKVEECLERFSAISVREEGSRRILREQFKIEAPIVLDPSLLLSKQDLIDIIGPDTSHYDDTFVYLLYKDTPTLTLVDALFKEGIANSPRPKGRIKGKIALFYGVRTWLRKIYSAKFIITNSFHCMAVSILLEKNFAIIPTFPGREGRMVYLLNKLGLSDRFVSSPQELNDKKSTLLKPVDYTNVRNLLNEERKKSESFILHNIVEL